MSIYIKKVMRKRTQRVQRHVNVWLEGDIDRAKQEILREVAQLFKNQYKVSTVKTDYRFVTQYEKQPVPNIDKTILIRLGGPFEIIGGKDEVVGGGNQKVGTNN